MDAAVMSVVRRQHSPPSTSCARLQPRQFSAHARDAGAAQRLVADDAKGKADQDRREGRQSRPLCHFPDGGGGDPSKCLRQHPANNSGTSTAGDSINGVVRLGGRESNRKRRGRYVSMTAIAIMFGMRRGIDLPAASSTPRVGAAGLPEPVGRGRFTSKRDAIWRISAELDAVPVWRISARGSHPSWSELTEQQRFSCQTT